MSWRHPEKHTAATTTVAQPFRAARRWPSAGLKACATRRRHPVPATRSIRNGRDLPRVERLEKLARRVEVELRILRFDAEEEPVAAGRGKPRARGDRGGGLGGGG